MAVSKISTPNPAIFSSDPTEQIYARGVVDRSNDMSGLSYMMLNAAQAGRKRDEDAYMSGLSQANRISAALAQDEERNKLNTEVLKVAAGLAKEGYNPSAMPAMGQVFADNTGPNDEFATLTRALLAAKANQANSTGATAGNDQYTSTGVVSPSGLVNQEFKAKGKSPSIDEENIKRMIAFQRRAKAEGLGTSRPGDVVAPPPSYFKPYQQQ